MISRRRGESASPASPQGQEFHLYDAQISRPSPSILDYESHFDGTARSHSRRSATIGSTFAARRAGIQHASIATKVSSGGITMNVIGSVALTPYSRPPIRRVTVQAVTSPAPTPASGNIHP